MNSVNDSPWLTHEAILSALNDPGVPYRAQVLRDYAAEAERVKATALAQTLREIAKTVYGGSYD